MYKFCGNRGEITNLESMTKRGHLKFWWISKEIFFGKNGQTGKIFVIGSEKVYEIGESKTGGNASFALGDGRPWLRIRDLLVLQLK